MRNLIYQFWDTQAQPPHKRMIGIPPAVATSSKWMKEYAERIGAEYLFELDPPHLHNLESAAYYGAVNPVFREEFHEYDHVLFLDADVYPVEGLKESPFDNFHGEIGIAQEVFEPMAKVIERSRIFGVKAEEAWAQCVKRNFNIVLPRDHRGLIKIFNSGVVLYSKEGMKRAKERFLPFADYIGAIRNDPAVNNFYMADQHYIHASFIAAQLSFQELDCGWNCQINFWEKDVTQILMNKTTNTKFVHNQMRGVSGEENRWLADENKLWKITNLPVEEWELGKRDVTNQLRNKLIC
jgi:hypothetical protein